MPTNIITKYETKRNNLFLRVARGHFASASCHSNYYIDVVAQKSRISEAKAVAEELRSYFYHTTIVDTILCLDGTEVIGACLADQLKANDFMNLNAHKSIYVVTPETVNGSQMLFRDNIVPMIEGKHVLVLAVSVASGKTVESAINAVKYYGGQISGVCSIFSTTDKVGEYPVYSCFNPKDLEGFASYPSHDCPLCRAGVKIDALVNAHGYSKL